MLGVRSRHQFLQLRQNPLRRCFGQTVPMAVDPVGRSGIRLQGDLGHQPQPAQQPQGVIGEVAFTDCAEAALGQVAQPPGGIHEPQGGLQRHRDGIEAEIPPLQVLLQGRAVLSGDVHSPTPEHQAGHIPLLIQNNNGAAKLLGQAAGEAECIAGDHEIEVRFLLQAIEPCITHRSANEGCPLRQPIQG